MEKSGSSIIVSLGFLFLVLLSGCSPVHRLELVDGKTYLEFPKGNDVKSGEVFVLYKYSKALSSDRSIPPKRVRKNVGRVRVAEIADDIHALVVVHKGELELGLKVEKLKQEDQ